MIYFPVKQSQVKVTKGLGKTFYNLIQPAVAISARRKVTGLSGRVTFSAQTMSRSVKPLSNRGWKASDTMGGRSFRQP